MKWKYWIILLASFVVLIILIFCYNFISHKVIVNKYPMLENKNYYSYESILISQLYVRDGEFVWEEGQKNIGDELIFNPNECNQIINSKGCKPEYNFICRNSGKEAKMIKSSEKNIPWSIGAWGNEYVINCDNLYWVYIVSDSTGPLGDVYGPFEK